MKKTSRTVRLTDEAWAYIDMCAANATRKPSEEIEHVIKMIRQKRHKDDTKAIQLATSGNQRQSSKPKPVSDESSSPPQQ